jgi:aspartate-semialdehyde dehydrogenase
MTNKKFNIVIVGATGLVGGEILSILLERNFPIAKLFLVASKRSAGKKIQVADAFSNVIAVEDFDWRQADFCFFSAGKEVSQVHVPLARSAGCIVIDNTSCFRYQDAIPLVIPEINADQALTNTVIANPNCSTMQLLLAVAPIHKAFGIKRMIVSTYQAVSGAGRGAIKQLEDDFSNGSVDLVPQIDELLDNGYSREEMKIVWESQKILADAALKVSATAVRVPIINGHSEAVTLELKAKAQLAEIEQLLQSANGVRYMPGPDWPTPAAVSGQDEVFVGRLRKDEAFDNGVSLWVVGDNLRKGAALNAVQIAEYITNNTLASNGNDVL